MKKIKLKDNSTLILEKAKPNDLDSIIQLIKDLAEFVKLSHEVCLNAEELSSHIFGPSPKAEVCMARLQKHDGYAADVGFMLYYHNFSTFLGKPGIYLEDLFVKPEFRSLGVGRIMLAYLAHTAISRNCGRLEWSVLNWNERAIAFYKSLGATPMNEWTVHRVTAKALQELANSLI